ncbi:DUF3570 domain-containing protein [Thalassotalea profundi]|uniref:DUF3570 domain-containing protein n=1 Tax=Thalassotalea profundi TaxID=2036687 RepID=A0ABQ3IAT1_9GAMM|nr:DUF3570 domain-containing protein [Thalassotalea profundi]GHE77277.1 hypothetical protein GCM10011501_00940 [Thalassotalea profundi]
MQLTDKKNVKALLLTATTTLLGTASVQAAETKADEWQFDTALMYYGETDRVTAVEAIIAGSKQFGNDEILSLKLTVDTLTGASANGAVAQNTPQTFTRPSGKGQYQIKAGETPLDDTFKDTRLQLTGQWTQPLTERDIWSIGGNLSKEYDYFSAAINSNIARDFNKKNTTVSAGVSFAFDQIDPEGGIPNAFHTMLIGDVDSSNFASDFDATRKESGDDKTTVDLLLGLTQVINRNMLVQLNYSYSASSGYMTDPFKVLSVVDQQGISQTYLYENRPDSRKKHAFFGQVKYHFDTTILDTSYRYMMDDWEIDSHTVDTKYIIPLANGHTIEPHFRFYTQTAAEFYKPFLLEGQVIPQFASADYRIGEMDAMTIGMKYGIPLSDGEHLSFRIAYYQQSPKSDGTQAVGQLNDLELYSKVDAIMAQISYSF